MPWQWPDPKIAARYAALGQVGLEMVAPIGLGLLLDHWLGIAPWLTIVGAVLGFFGGMAHLVVLLQPADRKKPPPPSEGDSS